MFGVDVLYFPWNARTVDLTAIWKYLHEISGNTLTVLDTYILVTYTVHLTLSFVAAQ